MGLSLLSWGLTSCRHGLPASLTQPMPSQAAGLLSRCSFWLTQKLQVHTGLCRVLALNSGSVKTSLKLHTDVCHLCGNSPRFLLLDSSSIWRCNQVFLRIKPSSPPSLTQQPGICCALLCLGHFENAVQWLHQSFRLAFLSVSTVLSWDTGSCFLTHSHSPYILTGVSLEHLSLMWLNLNLPFYFCFLFISCVSFLSLDHCLDFCLDSSLFLSVSHLDLIGAAVILHDTYT